MRSHASSLRPNPASYHTNNYRYNPPANPYCPLYTTNSADITKPSLRMAVFYKEQSN